MNNVTKVVGLYCHLLSRMLCFCHFPDSGLMIQQMVVPVSCISFCPPHTIRLSSTRPMFPHRSFCGRLGRQLEYCCEYILDSAWTSTSSTSPEAISPPARTRTLPSHSPELHCPWRLQTRLPDPTRWNPALHIREHSLEWGTPTLRKRFISSSASHRTNPCLASNSHAGSQLRCFKL